MYRAFFGALQQYFHVLGVIPYMKVKYTCFIITILSLFFSCSDDDFSGSSSVSRLHFSVDTVNMDTVFANVPTSTRSFWVYNRSASNVRLASVRLAGGNQQGFRVNVDGTYLRAETGYQASDLEVRKNDSIRVFVELTSPKNTTADMELIEGQLVFSQLGGMEQRVLLRASSWRARSVNNLRIQRDTTLTSETPIIVYGGIRIDSAATLTIMPGTTLFFHDKAGIDVYGRLLVKGTTEANVVLRGDRLDRMFSYLPYDRVSGQWAGLRIYEHSYGNEFENMDLHGAFDGLLVDSSDVTKQKLIMKAVTIHNCQGFGLMADNSQVVLQNCQISNTQNDCVRINGGKVTLTHCTLAQFYPFSSNRGAALWIAFNSSSTASVAVQNCLITGYANDVLMMGKEEKDKGLVMTFCDSRIRTPRLEEPYANAKFDNVVYESATDTAQLPRNTFAVFDEKNLYYDFRLKKGNGAVDAGSSAWALPTDRNGVARDAKPDLGAYEYKETSP